MERDIKTYFGNLVARYKADLATAEAEMRALDDKNDKAETEEEVKAVGEEIDALKAKIEDLKAQLAEAEAQLAELDKPANDPKPDEGERSRAIKNMKERGKNNMTHEEIEARAKAFAESNRAKMTTAEMRSTLISGGKIATPTEVGGINDNFETVSSIVDMVKVVDCEGMGAYKVAYKKADSTAAEQTEGSAITASDPTFGTVEITPTSYGVLSYISKQVKKQTPLNYEAKVTESAKTALRAKASALIVAKVKASTLTTEVEATVKSGKGVIDETTLRKIALAYGGDETVAGNAVLFLNKNDLVAFGDVRGTNEKKNVYEIIPDTANPNTGIIKDGGLSVKYCINSNITACNGTAQGAASGGADVKTMFYGNPQNFELGLFSAYEIAVSEDYKFAENMLTIRGDAEMGGDVTHDGGFVFLTIKKATA